MYVVTRHQPLYPPLYPPISTYLCTPLLQRKDTGVVA